jgi:hypothetical protein
MIVFYWRRGDTILVGQSLAVLGYEELTLNHDFGDLRGRQRVFGDVGHTTSDTPEG